MRGSDSAVPMPNAGAFFGSSIRGLESPSFSLQGDVRLCPREGSTKAHARDAGIEDAEWVYSPLSIPQTGGGLRLTSRDLLKIAELYLRGGEWKGKRIVDDAWVKTSTHPHAQIDDQTNYGYLWWLKAFKSGARSYPAFFMSGNGGNKIAVFPDLDTCVVITSTNYNTHGMHEQTEKMLTDYILPAVE